MLIRPQEATNAVTAPVTLHSVARSARRELTAIVQRRFPTAAAIGYGRSTDPAGVVLWTVLAADGAILWDAREGEQEIPEWADLGDAVDQLGQLVDNAAAYVGSLPAWHWRDLPDVDGVRHVARAVGEDLVCPLADDDDMELFRAVLAAMDMEG
jgi:hypothetical protein